MDVESELNTSNWNLFQKNALFQILIQYRGWAFNAIRLGFRKALDQRCIGPMDLLSVTLRHVLKVHRHLISSPSNQLIRRLKFEIGKKTGKWNILNARKTIQSLRDMFLFCLGSFSSHQIHQFIQAVTGEPYGISPITIVFVPTLTFSKEGKNWPTISTCVRELKVRSNYTSVDDMKSDLVQLLTWLEQEPGMHRI